MPKPSLWTALSSRLKRLEESSAGTILRMVLGYGCVGFGILLAVASIGLVALLIAFASRTPDRSSTYEGGLRAGLAAFAGTACVVASARAGTSLANGTYSRVNGLAYVTGLAAVAVWLYGMIPTLPAILDPTLRLMTIEDHDPVYLGSGKSNVYVCGVLVFWLPAFIAALLAQTGEVRRLELIQRHAEEREFREWKEARLPGIDHSQ